LTNENPQPVYADREERTGFRLEEERE
jgi:hypothetical protein